LEVSRGRLHRHEATGRHGQFQSHEKGKVELNSAGHINKESIVAES
jgi:hypothetical protein